jgi:cellulose synthase/poly-beta-1,6-N-acetylglucosamine synthase-like glycosyltransferase
VIALPITLCAVWLFLALITRLEANRIPKLHGVLPRAVEKPRVLAIVPARDEAEVVQQCLKCLLIQQGVELTAVLYDDRSRDQTAALAGEIAEGSGGRLRVISGTAEPPPGWCGKPHALMAALHEAGYHVMRGRMEQDDMAPHVILFLDADVMLRPTAVAEMAELMHENGWALCSALPHLVCKSFWERVAGPTVGALITARHKPSAVNSMKSKAVLANGQFLMVTPEAYSYVGGHEAVKTEVLEDVALAGLVKRSGQRVALVDGQKVVSTRMYDSLGELWRGWAKNAYKLVGGTPGKALGYAVFGLLLSFTPLACLFSSLVMASQGHALWPVWLAGYLVPLSMQVMLRRVGGQQWGYALFAPLGASVLAALLMKATLTALRRGTVTWKGRAYVDGVGVTGTRAPPPR